MKTIVSLSQGLGAMLALMAWLMPSAARAQRPEELSQAMYYLYANNMQDEWGDYTDEFLGLQSCGDVEIEASADLSRLWLRTYAGMEMPGLGLELRRTAGGRYEMPLGQTVYTHAKYGEVILATYDSKLRIYDTEGSVAFELKSGSLVCLYDEWIYGYCPAADRMFSDLTVKKPEYYVPNATVAYAIVDEHGKVTEQVSKPAIVDVRRDGEEVTGFRIGGMLPVADGFVARFDAVALPSGETVYAYDKAPVAPSGYDGGERTGYYRLQAMKSAGGQATDVVLGSYDAGRRVLTWCADSYLMGITGYDRWTAATASGRTLGAMTTATVKIDAELDIEAVAADSSDAAPEYYTLQGAKVAHPAPGHIYIVREGGSVAKRAY